MRILTNVQALSAAAAITLLAGCSGGSVIAPQRSTPQSQVSSIISPGSLGPKGMLALIKHNTIGYHGASFNACPATGLIEYVSVIGDGTVNVFAGNFKGQAACGIITGFGYPLDMIVKSGTLYVPDEDESKTVGYVKAFHRGGTAPFLTYSDPCFVLPISVAVSDDGYVYATNQGGCGAGASLSVWKKSTGAFVQNYPGPTDWNIGAFMTIQKDGTAYFDANNSMWTSKCVKGVCGSFTNLGLMPGGAGAIRSVDGEHVVVAYSGRATALTFTPPNFSSPSGSCSFGLNPETFTIAINFAQSHIYALGWFSGTASEFKYPAGGGNGGPCVLIGSVSASSTYVWGIAVDRPASL
jgi:hypothetical protein